MIILKVGMCSDFIAFALLEKEDSVTQSFLTVIIKYDINM